MNKIQKNFLIIFLLFFIFYLINKTFSLKFKEGNEEEICDESVNNQCKYYEKNKILCKKEKKSACESKYCKLKFYGIKPEENNYCEFSQCLRPYGNKKKGCVSDLDDQSNIYDASKNPCMNVDFCKNCSSCYEFEITIPKKKKKYEKELWDMEATMPLKYKNDIIEKKREIAELSTRSRQISSEIASKGIDCKKCLHNGRLKLEKTETAGYDNGGFKSYFPSFFCSEPIRALDCNLKKITDFS
jgi:hypothetical protein